MSQLIHRIKLVRKILKGERVGGGRRGGREKDEGRWKMEYPRGRGRGRVSERRKKEGWGVRDGDE